MRPYNAFAYIFPPRPASKIGFDPNSPVYRAWVKSPNAVAQLKLNGSRNVIFVSPDRKVQMWNRHKEPHRSYTLPQFMVDKLLALPMPEGWNVFDSELMHLKTPSVKDTLYFFDVLVWGGQYLIDQTYEQRYRHVLDWGLPFFPQGNGKGGIDGIDGRIDGNLFCAESYRPDQWASAFASTGGNTRVLGGDVYEGLVLKMTGATSALKTGYVEENNGGWLCRLRRPHKNFQN